GIRRITTRIANARVRAARRARTQRRPRRQARPAPRPRLGNFVRRWNAHRGRSCRTVAQEARASGADPDGARRRLPAPRRRAVNSLQAQLRLAIGAAVLGTVSLSLLVGAYLVRRSLEQNAFDGLRRQVALLANEEM